MCILKNTIKLLIFLPLFVEVLTLEVVPIEKNVILNTEFIIRNVTNDIFVELKLKGVKNNTRLQQHNIVHNFFTKLGVADQHTLAAVNTVSRFDKTNTNYKTRAFMDILSELFQEDWINDEENSLTNNVNVLKFISNYLSGGGRETIAEKRHDFNEVIENLEHDLAEENIVDNSDEDNIYERSNNETGENEFWKPGPSGRRIYQGIKTKIRNFPFMASIQIFHSFQCGGSIIKSDLILTAASCLQLAYNNRFFRENPAFLSVRVGSDFYQGGGDNIEALEVYFEPSYDPKTLKHNLALIRLQRQINFRKTKKVKRIEIDRKAHSVPYNAGPLLIIGWGAKTASNILDSPWSNRLSYAEQGLYHFRDCENIYSKEYVTRTNFCAGSAAKGSGACNKDAGDPGVIAGILVGVASFGSPVCGTPDVPTVFTKVGFYADWIDEIMGQRVPTRNKFTTTKLPYRPYTPDLKKELHRLTAFTVTPIAGTISSVPVENAETVPPHLLRNKKKDQDEELKDILYNMIDDTKDPGNLRDRIQQMLPQIKKYATTPKPKTTEEFLTTDIANQKHTIIDRVIDDDVDLNIAQIIDKLDVGDDVVHEQLMFEESTTMKAQVKKIKTPLKDIPNSHEDMAYEGDLLHADKETGVREAEAFNIGPIEDDIKEMEPVKPKPAKKVANKEKLEHKKQDLKKSKLRDYKQEVKAPKRPVTKQKLPETPVASLKLPERSVKKLKLPERSVPVQPVTKNKKKEKIAKWDVNKKLIYPDDDDDLVIENIKRQKNKLPQEKINQPASNIDNLGTIDNDKLVAVDDISIGDSFLGVTEGQSAADGHGGVNNILNAGDGLGDLSDRLNTGGHGGFVAQVDELAEEIHDIIKDTSIDQAQVRNIDDGFQKTTNVGKIKKHEKGKVNRLKDETMQYGEFDYNPAAKDDQKDKKEVTEDVLTLLYLSSEEEKAKGKKKSKKKLNEEKHDVDPSLKDLIDFDKENDGLEAVDEFFEVPLKNDEKKTLYNNLPKDKLYDLLSEAINDMTSKKRSNRNFY